MVVIYLSLKIEIIKRSPIFIFLIKRNAKIDKRRKRNGENINNFFNNIEFGVFKYVLLASGISN